MTDSVFGEMIYKGGWFKEDTLRFWGKKISVKIVVSAYETETPNREQQQAYLRLKDETNVISEESLSALRAYIMTIQEDIKAYTNITEIPDDVNELVSINEILLTEKGSIGIICNTKWDSHGIAVLCKGEEISVGTPDIVWFD